MTSEASTVFPTPPMPLMPIRLATEDVEDEVSASSRPAVTSTSSRATTRSPSFGASGGISAMTGVGRGRKAVYATVERLAT